MLKGQKNMGQMILFINTTNQQIIDVLHDGFNVIRKKILCIHGCRTRNIFMKILLQG
ncbi:WSSV378 [White spot syndrome virus]|uniref:WSSV378 n=1 Tax=White spot syndrome virus TaxID=342409 RepID=A0A2I6SC64_9VIRU|nr:WSSV378 [White spot syndrome virus]